MEFDTSFQDEAIRIDKLNEEITKLKEFIPSKLPVVDDIDDNNQRANPFLDSSVRQLLEDFILTWHKILFELLDVQKYELLRIDQIWNFLFDFFNLLKGIFWIPDRLFFIGVGFIIISFFVFFICVTR
jgi:hypothetical protein